MGFKFILCMILAYLQSSIDSYELGKAYIYEYDSHINVEYSQQERFALKKLPLTYESKVTFYLEVKKTNPAVEFVAKMESLETASLYSEETKKSFLNKFSFEFDKNDGRIGRIWFGENETPGSKLFKKSFIDHFNFGNSKVF